MYVSILYNNILRGFSNSLIKFKQRDLIQIAEWLFQQILIYLFYKRGALLRVDFSESSRRDLVVLCVETASFNKIEQSSLR